MKIDDRGPVVKGWCRVESKEALLHQIEEGQRLHRLVLVAAAYQCYYYERMFCNWAKCHPLLMFVTIKLDSGEGPQFFFSIRCMPL